jgi:PAS domain S-box-containing protein
VGDQSLRVVIVEDIPQERQEIKALLLRGSDRRYVFAEAATGVAGLKLCTAAPAPSCAILDFGLPDMTAVEMLEAMPRDRFGSLIPVVILTMTPNEQVSRAVLKAGAQEFVGKGWLTAESITRAVENAIERRQAASELVRQGERQTLLLEVTQLILSNIRDEARLVEAIFERIAVHLDSDTCFFHRMAPDNALLLAWAAGLPDSMRDAVARFDLDPARAEGADSNFDSGHITCAQTAADPLAPIARAIGARAYARHFLRNADGTVIGTLAIGSTRRAEYSPEDIRSLETICRSLSVAFERRTVEAALRKSEERLRIAIAAAELSTFDWDIVADRITWSGDLIRRQGIRPEDAPKSIEEIVSFVHPDDLERVRGTLQASLAKGDRYECEFRMIRADGAERWVLGMAQIFRDAQGRATTMLGVDLDITARKLAEEELAQAKDTAEAANAAKDQFLAVLSHELRTPLTPLSMIVSIWERRKDLPPQLQRELDIFRRNIDLECSLIDDLLDLNRVARGKLELRLDRVDLRDEVRHAIKMVESDASNKRIAISVGSDAAPAEVMGDAARLQQVFWNLLKNAVKFTPANGSISVRTYKPSSERVCVEVRDTGRGVEPKELEQIFNAFEQGGTNVTRQFGGMGLGLAISKAIATVHGGTLSAYSAGTDRGATFTLELDAARPAESDAADRGLAAQHASDLSSPRQERLIRVLLVEDDADTAELMKILLRQLGYDVHRAGGVEEALAIYESHPFDLIISDVGLPDGTGYELMRQAMAKRPIKAIALSGYATADDIEHARRAGFIAHLAKPMSIEQLEKAIQRAVGSPRH